MINLGESPIWTKTNEKGTSFDQFDQNCTNLEIEDYFIEFES